MLKVVTHIDYTFVGDGEDSEWSGKYVNPDGAAPTQAQVNAIGITVPVPAKAVGVFIVYPATPDVRHVNINNTDTPNYLSQTLNFYGPIKFPSPGFVTSLFCESEFEGGEFWTFYWL